MRGFYEFYVLVGHGGDDLHEGFVGDEYTVSSGDVVAVQKSEECVFGEHFHDFAFSSHVFVPGFVGPLPGTFGFVENGVNFVGVGFVGAEDTEIVGFFVEFEYFLQKASTFFHGTVFFCAGGGNLVGEFFETRVS